ncbi:MAG: phosphate-starvation-inducible PsiE family protein [Gammaproteobacteria bacterium]
MEPINQRKKRPLSETRQYWGVMSLFERFEQVIALVLSVVIATIIVVALWRLIREVVLMLVLGALDPLDHSVFQGIFGMIMTLLIAMEFKHSIIRVIHRNEHIIQVKTVILIAQLALVRKFIILDLNNTGAMEVFALGFAVLVLAVAHWLMRERDRAESLDEAASRSVSGSTK